MLTADYAQAASRLADQEPWPRAETLICWLRRVVKRATQPFMYLKMDITAWNAFHRIIATALQYHLEPIPREMIPAFRITISICGRDDTRTVASVATDLMYPVHRGLPEISVLEMMPAEYSNLEIVL